MKNPPPHKDSSLTNREGENWKDIPGLEGFFQVSNLGRVKRLERSELRKDGAPLRYDTKIILPGVVYKKKFERKYGQHLQAAFTCNGKIYRYQVSRLLYHLFVAPIELSNLDWLVTSKNGDGLDVRPENLLLEKIGDAHKRARQRSGNTGHWAKVGGIKGDKFHKHFEDKFIEVSSYDLKGRLVETFPSFKAAAFAMGIAKTSISRAVKLLTRKAAGYYWRRGAANMINFKELNNYIKERDKIWIQQKGTPVRQYSLDGVLIREYKAVARASKASGVSKGAIWQNIRGVSAQAGGFRWVLV